MTIDQLCDGMLQDAHSLLNKAEELAKASKGFDTLNQKQYEGAAQWIDFDEKVETQRPKDGELVVVQVADCQPFMLTYLKGCKVQINKWFRLPEWK